MITKKTNKKISKMANNVTPSPAASPISIEGVDVREAVIALRNSMSFCQIIPPPITTPHIIRTKRTNFPLISFHCLYYTTLKKICQDRN
jgi:hypothetical protein